MQPPLVRCPSRNPRRADNPVRCFSDNRIILADIEAGTSHNPPLVSKSDL
jgi:hypothetical protein